MIENKEESIVIEGGVALQGTIHIAGAKNAALPLLAAALLTSQDMVLENIPQMTDIKEFFNLMMDLGTAVSFQKVDPVTQALTVHLSTKEIIANGASDDVMGRMRASVLVLAPVLARRGHAHMALPGGCAIGQRPIDLHLKALRTLGAEIDVVKGYIEARCLGGSFVGGEIIFPFETVGGTENAIMAAAVARGASVIVNAAREPEVVDLCNCLVKMGAKIQGIGTGKLTIQGVEDLGGCRYRVMGDRIQAGTYVIAGAMTRGLVTVQGALNKDSLCVYHALRESGVDIQECDEETVLVDARSLSEMKAITLHTGAYPGFPTDMQAQYMALMLLANGVSLIYEEIFENRFMHVEELKKLKGDIVVQGNKATIRGNSILKGAQVQATDLRASVSLILGGLVAQGETRVTCIHHLDRGYDFLEHKLQLCGARIQRVSI